MIDFNFLLFPLADMASAFWDSTLPGKIIVLILFFGSAAAWTIMWTKGIQLKSAKLRINAAKMHHFPHKCLRSGDN